MDNRTPFLLELARAVGGVRHEHGIVTSKGHIYCSAHGVVRLLVVGGPVVRLGMFSDGVDVLAAAYEAVVVDAPVDAGAVSS